MMASSRQQVVAALVDDLSGDLLLAAHGINADQKAFHVQCFEQFRNGGDFVALLLDALLTKDNAQIGGERTDDMGWSASPLGRAANRLAIGRHLPRWRSGRYDLTHPAAKEGFELLGIKCPEQTIKGRRRRDTILQRQKLPQLGLARLCPKGKVLTGIHVTKAGADGDHLQLPEIVECSVAGIPRVFNLIEGISS